MPSYYIQALQRNHVLSVWLFVAALCSGIKSVIPTDYYEILLKVNFKCIHCSKYVSVYSSTAMVLRQSTVV